MSWGIVCVECTKYAEWLAVQFAPNDKVDSKGRRVLCTEHAVEYSWEWDTVVEEGTWFKKLTEQEHRND